MGEDVSGARVGGFGRASMVWHGIMGVLA
jgi:hypothetical protein